MKKLFFAIAAVAMMTSCMEDATIVRSDMAKIELGSYLQSRADENPSITDENIAAFDVWAFMDRPSGQVFDQERVEKDAEGKWGYANTQYWNAGHTYYFAALAPVDHSNIEVTLANAPYIAAEGLGTVTFTNLDGTDDLIYAEEVVVTPATITSMAPVHLGFAHLLSKVRFSFKNCLTNKFSKLVVTDIAMKVPSKATIDLTQDTYSWVLDTTVTETATLDLGGAATVAAPIEVGQTVASSNHRLTIPADATQKYEVSFKVVKYEGDVEGDTYEKSAVIENCKFEPGKAYNFKVELNAENLNLLEIVFDQPEVTEWVEQDVDGAVTIQ